MTLPVALPGRVIKQGDSLRTLLGLRDVPDLSGWKCRVVINATVGGASPVLPALNVTTRTDDDARFVHLLTRDTTKNWAPGDYLYMADVYNESTGEGKELHGELRVDPQGVV